MASVTSQNTNTPTTTDNITNFNLSCKRPPKLLQLSPSAVSSLDPRDLESVYSLWAVFSKCGAVLENGKRLGNMSWRLWSRDLLYNPRNGLETCSSESSVPELGQVPKLSSSVESSTSSCTSTSNQRGSNDKLTMTKTTTPLSPSQEQYPSLPILETSAMQHTSGRALKSPHFLPSQPSSASKAERIPRKPLSPEALRRLLQLFSSDNETPIWKVDTKPAATLTTMKQTQQSPDLGRQDPAAGPRPANINPTNLRHHSSLFKQTPPINGRRDSQPSLSHLSKQGRSASSLSSKKQFHPTSITTDNRVPANVTRSALTAKIEAVHPTKPTGLVTGAAPPPADAAKPAKLSNTTSSLFPARKEPIKRTMSLFARHEPTSTMTSKQPVTRAHTTGLVRNGKHVHLGDGYNVTTREVEKYSSDDDDAGREPSTLSDTDADSESESDFEGIDSNGSRLTFRHRTNTATSIVRGFSQGSVSVSRRASTVNMTPATKKVSLPAGSGMSEMTKARPDKVARENMFFIESSSPSESELGQNSLSSHTSEYGSMMKSSTDGTSMSSGKLTSLFTTSSVGDTKKSPEHKANPQHSLKAVSENDSEEDDDIDGDEDDGDDDSAWDSLDDESESGSFDEISAFSRDDAKPKPLVRPSLLSSLFLDSPDKLQEEHKARLSSQSKSSESGSTDKGKVSSTIKNNSPDSSNTQATRSGPPPTARTSLASVGEIEKTGPRYDLLSPRTTRRNMLASELSASVRRDLLWERKPVGVLKSDGSGTGKLARRHTSIDVAGLTRSHQQESTRQDESSQNNNTNTLENAPLPGESWLQDLENESNGYFDYNAAVW